MDAAATREGSAEPSKYRPPLGESLGAAGQTPVEPRWTMARKVGFRFAFSYLCLYLYPFSDTFSFPTGVSFFRLPGQPPAYEAPWRQLVPWVEAHLLHLSDPVRFTSGAMVPDSAYNYVKVLCFVVVAAVATALWSALDRKRLTYSRLNRWLRVYVGLALAMTMIPFGIGKVIPLQSMPPGLIALMRPFGEVTPYRFFWTFLGDSDWYMIFAGVVETLGGVLLLIPATVTAGALISLGAMTAVVTQSGFYGVPDKVAQLHLALLAFFLILPDVPRLLNVVVLNRATESKPSQPLLRRRWANYSVLGLQWALALYVIVTGTVRGVERLHIRNALPLTTPLYGIWRVEDFTADGAAGLSPLTNNPRWSHVVFDSYSLIYPKLIVAFQEMSGEFTSAYVATADAKDSTLSLRSPSVWAEKYWSEGLSGEGGAQLKYSRLSPDAVILEGPMNGHPLRMTLRKENRRFNLTPNRFHWIIEYNETGR